MTLTALRFGDETVEPTELERRVDLVAGGLHGLGVALGDVVALMLRNEPAAIEITLACNRLGAYHCPVNWRFKEEELAYILADSGAKVLFVHPDLLPAVAGGFPAGLIVIEVVPQALTVASFKLIPTSARRTAYHDWREAQVAWSGEPRAPMGRFAYTSGTTGRPKGVRRLPETMHPEQPRLLREVVRATFGFEPGARAFLSAPFYHGAPNLYAGQAALYAESLTLEPRFDAEATLRLIEAQRLTHLYLVPTMCVRLLALPAQVKQRHDLSSLRFVCATGSPFAPDVKRAMIDWWGPVFYESYASSECGMTTVIDSVDWLRRPGSVGRALGLADVRIVDDAGRELAANEVGNIHIRQPAYADFTYHNLPDARAAIDYRGLACVGDIGYLDADGYLYISDRKSDMVISGGVNIYPAETEAHLAAMPGVADCVVFGIPDAEFGEALAAVIQTEPGVDLRPEAVRAWLKPKVAAYKVPKLVEFMQTLPREESGKIMKRKIRAGYWERAGRKI